MFCIFRPNFIIFLCRIYIEKYFYVWLKIAWICLKWHRFMGFMTKFHQKRIIIWIFAIFIAFYGLLFVSYEVGEKNKQIFKKRDLVGYSAWLGVKLLFQSHHWIYFMSVCMCITFLSQFLSDCNQKRKIYRFNLKTSYMNLIWVEWLFSEI